jgi:hypothetical protein
MEAVVIHTVAVVAATHPAVAVAAIRRAEAVVIPLVAEVDIPPEAATPVEDIANAVAASPHQCRVAVNEVKVRGEKEACFAARLFHSWQPNGTYGRA